MLFMVPLVAGALLMVLVFWPRRGRYQSPNLHEGRWGKPKIEGSSRQLRVVWALLGGPHACSGGHHEAVRCTIGPGMAHLDECVCGATRSGVYGQWLC